MRRTIWFVVLFLTLFLGMGGMTFAMPHKDYEGCDGKCEERSEAASLNCLAETIYYEAGNQPTNGKVAVAFVVRNRAKKNNLSICDVVYQHGQFYWVPNVELRRRPKNQTQWEACQNLARDFLAHPERYDDPTHGATAFRRPNDAPFPKRWIAAITIGGHIFYHTD